MITSYVTLSSAPWQEVLQFALSLFAILNPFGVVAIYLSMVDEYSHVEKVKILRKSSIAVFVILICVIWVGDSILNFFGISIAAFRIGGGLIIVLFGLKILSGTDSSEKEDSKTKAVARPDISVVPLAIPIIAGPGALVVTLTEMHNTFNEFKEKLIVSAVCVFIAIAVWLILRNALVLSKFLGTAGLNILTKVMGLFLVVIATQMMLEGCIAIFPGWVR